MIVVTPRKLVQAQDGISRPSIGSGHASTLTMTDDEKAAVAERPRPPFGFRGPA